MVDGIHEHFPRTHARGERQFRRRMRIGVLSLGIGLAVLGASIGLRSLLGDVKTRALAQGFAEGLLILGWVTMWRPVEILLFEHWESHLDHAVLERLASIAVSIHASLMRSFDPAQTCWRTSVGRASRGTNSSAREYDDTPGAARHSTRTGIPGLDLSAFFR